MEKQQKLLKFQSNLLLILSSLSIAELAQIIAEEVGYKGVYGFDKSKPDGQFKKPSSNEKLRKLGWDGEYTPLREGLRETIKFFVEEYPQVRGVTIRK